MNGIEQAIEKMVHEATADLRERVRALEALAEAVRGAAFSLAGAEVEAAAEVPVTLRPSIEHRSNGHGNGATKWTTAMRRAAAKRMKNRMRTPSFRKAQAKGTARRWRQWHAQHEGNA